MGCHVAYRSIGPYAKLCQTIVHHLLSIFESQASRTVDLRKALAHVSTYKTPHTLVYHAPCRSGMVQALPPSSRAAVCPH